MTRAEYESYLEKVPYDAMGDYSVFLEEKNKESPPDQEKDPQES